MAGDAIGTTIYRLELSPNEYTNVYGLAKHDISATVYPRSLTLARRGIVVHLTLCLLTLIRSEPPFVTRDMSSSIYMQFDASRSLAYVELPDYANLGRKVQEETDQFRPLRLKFKIGADRIGGPLYIRIFPVYTYHLPPAVRGLIRVGGIQP